VPLRRKEGTTEIHHIEQMRSELDLLFKKQREILKSREFGVATDAEILEYEIRQEIIHAMCNELANSAAA
jgi:hypothetical protein